MARPRKEEMTGCMPTRERILATAIRLFSRNGFEGTSIRDIARAVELNEASLYNHFPSKGAILEAAIQRLEERLLAPEFGLRAVDADAVSSAGGDASIQGDETSRGDDALMRSILDGATRFFSRADEEMRSIWRILVTEQYRNTQARTAVENRVLRAPRGHLLSMLEAFRSDGLIEPGTALESAADILASIFFEFSFVSNLSLAWDTIDPSDTERMKRSVAFVAGALARRG